MINRIDWISFTFGFTLHKVPNTNEPIIMSAVWSLSQFIGAEPVAKIFEGGFETGNGRPPYRDSICDLSGGIRLFFNQNLRHALVEVSGKGCETLERLGLLESILDTVKSTVTRLDLACDWLSDVTPADFAEKRANQRFKAFGSQSSDSGETCYVGSRKSDRYARVYRYRPPHPRSEFLRCEMVFRRQQAKIAVDHLLANGLNEAVDVAGNVFGWSHELWSQTHQSDEELAAWRPERHSGKTVRWLITQVAPALVRLAVNDEIDLAGFLTDHVLKPYHRQRPETDDEQTARLNRLL